MPHVVERFTAGRDAVARARETCAARMEGSSVVWRRVINDTKRPDFLIPNDNANRLRYFQVMRLSGRKASSHAPRWVPRQRAVLLSVIGVNFALFVAQQL